LDALAIMRHLARVGQVTSQGRPLQETLQAVADGVVEALGFGTAVVNYVVANGNLWVAAVAGPCEAREALLGKVIPRAEVDRMLRLCEPRGALRFIPHGTYGLGPDYEWIPPHSGEPLSDDDWHPEDGLLAPMYDAAGDLLGFLSVDQPPDGRQPSSVLCELLELFAVQAGIAISVARLMDDLRREHDRLAASETAVRFFFTGSAGAMITVSLKEADFGTILQANEASCRLLARPMSAVEGTCWLDLVHLDDRADSLHRMVNALPGADLRTERRLVRPDGSIMWVGLIGTAIPLDPDRAPVLLLHLDDITERKAREANLMQMASVDPLTGLLNRRAFLARLEAAVAESERDQEAGVVGYADLVRFKDLNDRHGHATGDDFLMATAARLRALLRTRDVVARIGGDEFAFVVADLDPADASVLLERIRAAIRQPFSGLAGVRMDVSLGIAPLVLPGGNPASRDAEEVLHEADLAMYRDKRISAAAIPAGRRRDATDQARLPFPGSWPPPDR
jgi:diguanylate cyclase (GGDEF)-like protein/PAS domain S-box-containing protein